MKWWKPEDKMPQIGQEIVVVWDMGEGTLNIRTTRLLDDYELEGIGPRWVIGFDDSDAESQNCPERWCDAAEFEVWYREQTWEEDESP